jgi:hypothetical protein
MPISVLVGLTIAAELTMVAILPMSRANLAVSRLPLRRRKSHNVRDGGNVMDYPITEVLVEHLLDGLRDNEARRAGIEARVAAAIARLPEHAQRNLSSEAVFAGVSLSAKHLQELRAMAANPAFKVEPVISQLRRAESGYIEAHDAYLKDPASGRRVEEMRWAHERLTITRQFYDGVLAALPPARRDVPARPVVTDSKAIKRLKLTDFSAEEQQVLRLAVVERDKAILQLDDIIASGRASGQDLRIIQSYLIDPVSAGMFKRWLVDELAAARPTASSGHPGLNNTSSVRTPPDDAFTVPHGNGADEVIQAGQPGASVPVDEATRASIETLEGWLDRFPGMLNRFDDTSGRWAFNDVIASKTYAGAYALVADHPKFQAMITRRKTAGVPAGSQ